jgi:hypothetical protein
MIVIDPTITDNIISVLPRYYAEMSTDITVIIKNEDTRKALAHNITNLLFQSGFLSFNTDANFKNNVTYSIKIVDNYLNLVTFRGKIFATIQPKQNYSING